MIPSPWKSTRPLPVVVPLTGFGLMVGFFLISRIDHLTIQAPTYLGILFAAFALYAVACISLWKPRFTSEGRVILALFLFGLIFRVPFWSNSPSLSTDIWRYLWDGRLLSLGVNPYAERVDSPALDAYTTPVRSKVDQAWMATPYPPLAEAAFSLGYSATPDSPRALQVGFTLFDLGTAWLILLLLKELGVRQSRVVLYLWNPLIVVEFAHSGHVDAMMTFFMLLALLWTIKGRQTGSAIALGLAVISKIFPIALTPAFLRRWGIRRALLFAAVITLPYLPFLGAGLGLDAGSDGTGIFGAARIYAAQWQTNAGLFHWLVVAISPIAEDPAGWVKVLGLTAVVGVGIWILLRPWWRTRREDAARVIDESALIISLIVLFSAAFFPWYLTWLLALLAPLSYREEPGRVLFIVAWVYFSAAVNLSYLFYLDPANPREIEWVRAVEYLPTFALLAGSVAAQVLGERKGSGGERASAA